nr:MAG TPA: hypothetical protein [Inoviridae sp.]
MNVRFCQKAFCFLRRATKNSAFENCKLLVS